MRGLFDEGKPRFYAKMLSFPVKDFMQVNGEYVYGKGAEIAAKAILGPIGKISDTLNRNILVCP